MTEDRDGTYHLHDPLNLTSPRKRFLTFRMHKLSHRSRANKKRALNLMPQNRTALIDRLHIPHHSRPPNDTLKERPVPISRDAVSSTGTVERPCLLGEGSLGYIFKVL